MQRRCDVMYVLHCIVLYSWRMMATTRAEKEIIGLALAVRRRVVDRIATLAADPRPHGCVKLSGQDKHRVCQGAYRVVYTIDDAIVTVVIVRVAHRRDVYR